LVCEATAAELTAMGPGKCVALPADLSKLDECVRVKDEITATYGGGWLVPYEIN